VIHFGENEAMKDYLIVRDIVRFTRNSLIEQNLTLFGQPILGSVVMLCFAFSVPAAESADRQVEATATVRYIVQDVPKSVDFYTKQLGFSIALDARPGFAVVARGALRLALSGTTGPGGGSRAMPDGRKPEPGGWNRIQIPVKDLDTEVARMRAASTSVTTSSKGMGARRSCWTIRLGTPSNSFRRTEHAKQAPAAAGASLEALGTTADTYRGKIDLLRLECPIDIARCRPQASGRHHAGKELTAATSRCCPRGRGGEAHGPLNSPRWLIVR
jgi:hypothetical protein